MKSSITGSSLTRSLQTASLHTEQLFLCFLIVVPDELHLCTKATFKLHHLPLRASGRRILQITEGGGTRLSLDIFLLLRSIKL